MPVIDIDRYDHQVLKGYHRREKESVGPTMEWLSEVGLMPKIEGFLNKILTAFGQDAIAMAVQDRSMVVGFKLNMVKISGKLWAEVDENFKKAGLTEAQLMLAMEILLEEGGFYIENHTVSYSMEIPPVIGEGEETLQLDSGMYFIGVGEVVRRIDDLVHGAVHWTVVKSGAKNTDGMTGKSSYKQFLSWIRDMVDPDTFDPLGEPEDEEEASAVPPAP